MTVKSSGATVASLDDHAGLVDEFLSVYQTPLWNDT